MQNNAIANYSCWISHNRQMIPLNNSWLCVSNGEAPSPPVTPHSSAAVCCVSYVIAFALCYGALFFTGTYQLDKCAIIQTLKWLSTISVPFFEQLDALGG